MPAQTFEKLNKYAKNILGKKPRIFYLENKVRKPYASDVDNLVNKTLTIPGRLGILLLIGSSKF